MKTKALIVILASGFLMSVMALITTQGQGVEAFVRILSYTSVALFVCTSATIVRNILQRKRQASAFFFLMLSAPLTYTLVRSFLMARYEDRIPDLRPQYDRPVSAAGFAQDSSRFITQLGKLVDTTNAAHPEKHLTFLGLDTVIYSLDAKTVFVVYLTKKMSANRGEFEPHYAWADRKRAGDWLLEEGSVNGDQVVGSYESPEEVRATVRQFYFNRYAFAEADSMAENYFWKRVNGNE